MRIFLLIAAIFLGTSSAMAQYAPVGSSPTENLVFSWPADPAATSYTLYIEQYGNDTVLNLTPAQAGCPSGTGTCSPVSGAPGYGIVCGRPTASPVCTQGHTISWWIQSNPSGASVRNMAYIPLSGQGENIVNDYAVNYDFAWDTTPCTKWTFPANFIGGQRRAIDLSVGSGTNNLGIQMFHQALWNTIDISDIVPIGPTGARVAILSIEVGYSATCSAAASGGTCDLMGWGTRRHGTTEANIPVLQFYTSAERDHKIWPVLLDQSGRFDFYWDDGANGIYPKIVNSATVTGEFINAQVIGYCTP